MAGPKSRRIWRKGKEWVMNMMVMVMVMPLLLTLFRLLPSASQVMYKFKSIKIQ